MTLLICNRKLTFKLVLKFAKKKKTGLKPMQYVVMAEWVLLFYA